MNEQDKQKYYGNEAFESIWARMQEEHAPQLVSYTPLDEQTLAERISAVLRPVYDRAIAAIFRENKRSNAELDADAISRGMGSSTFVSDLKRRQDNAASENAQDMEIEYGSKLSDQLYRAMDAEQSRVLETERFNAQQRADAMSQAFEAARVLYEAYLAERESQGGGGGGGRKTQPTAADRRTSLAYAVALARGGQPTDPNGAAFYAGGDRETARRVASSDLPHYVRMRGQMNGDHSSDELSRYRRMNTK